MINDWFDFGDEMTPETDERRGREIVEYFVKYHRNQFPNTAFSIDEWVSFYGSVGPFMFENIGMNQRVQNLSMSEAKDIMAEIVDRGDGMIPNNWMKYSQSMAHAVQDYSWWEALPYVTVKSLKEAAAVGFEAGQGLKTTLEMGRWTMPIIIYGGLGLAIYFVAKGLQGSTESIGRGLGRATESVGRGIGDRIRKR